MNPVARPGSLAEALLARAGEVGADPADDEDTRSSKGLLVLISLLILPISVLWGVLYLAFGSPVGFVPLLYFGILAGAIAVFARTRDFSMLLRVNLLDILLAPTLSMAPLGGFLGAGGVGLWGVLAPLGALVFSDVRTAVRWFVAWVVVFVGSGTAGIILGPIPPPIPTWFTTTMLALNITVGSTLVFTLLAVFAMQRRTALAALRVEQGRAESLLLNILPSSIADRLKVDAQTIADQFSAASILFADVVDFTPRSEHLEPGEVVGLLDHLFTHFDVLAEGYRVEKIKTIGDCYMVAAGVPNARADHARALVALGLDMVEAMHSSDDVGHLGLELRVGINSGPVVAGVIGRKRFLYDLWGDAVNTASRMESHGTAGRVQITRATYELVEDDFECEPRGTISVKGKGEMEIWHVLRRRPEGAIRDPAQERLTDAVATGSTGSDAHA
ncbi:MAG TPA: adenylate/guanylate cyclase domain-containing protein [Candidatus Limnocylindrales bacterium]|nr:adenylate/guanylate cyclase domain-containing protein [Candidatus Limnocylindrales bacterium]